MLLIGIVLVIASVFVEGVAIQGLSVPTSNATLSVAPGSYEYVPFKANSLEPFMITYVSSSPIDAYFVDSGAMSGISSLGMNGIFAAAQAEEGNGTLLIERNGSKGAFPYKAEYASIGLTQPYYYDNVSEINGTYYAIFANTGNNVTQITYYVAHAPNDYVSAAASSISVWGILASVMFLGGIATAVYSFFKRSKKDESAAGNDEQKVNELYNEMGKERKTGSRQARSRKRRK